jgi:hypothetical protein
MSSPKSQRSKERSRKKTIEENITMNSEFYYIFC